MTVHNHPPYRPVCNERSVDGQLRGACLNDDGSPAMSADPTAEHIDAVARIVHRFVESHDRDEMVAELLTSTDPAVHAAMLDALVRAGVLTEEQCCAHARAAQADGDYRSYTCEDAGTHCPPPRLVTRWEVAP